jgi:hypothetical protein
MTNPIGGYLKSTAFDFFHINSIEKDSKGNYLMSSRHTHSISCISPEGDFLWILGGQRNQFDDLSDGDALNFRWQHDARWVDEKEGIISLFDNKEGGPLHKDGPFSRGLLLQLDVANRTVTKLHDYVSMHKTRAPSQGSTQYLPDSKHVFVAFGHSPVLSEFDINGTLLCETHFGSTWLHPWNTAVSYRAFKSSNWIGKPREPPVAKIVDDVLYVNWNGATEVSAWVLQGAQELQESFVDLDFADKLRYEETFDLATLSTQYDMFRVAALDKDGKILGYTDVAVREEITGWSSILFLGFLWVVALRAGWAGYKWYACRKHHSAKRGVSWVTWRRKQ